MNNLILDLEDDEEFRVDFNGETMTFSLLLNKYQVKLNQEELFFFESLWLKEPYNYFSLTEQRSACFFEVIFVKSFEKFQTSYQKLWSNLCGIGDRHYSSTIVIEADIPSNGNKLLFGICANCKRKNSRTVNVNKIKAEGLVSFSNL